jgi:methoxymalonate biosynthesis acyl carrier protein
VPERHGLVNELIALFAEQLAVEIPSASTDLIDAGLLDSAKFVDLLLCLEQRFGVYVDLNELELDCFRSVQGIAALVAQHKAATG